MKTDRSTAPRLPQIMTELQDITAFQDYRTESIRMADTVIREPLDLALSESELDHVTFAGNGRGCRFTDVIFKHCDFSGAVFDEASFCRCRFDSCRCLGTSFIRASFIDVTAEESVFTYANFSGSSMDRVKLAGCGFRESAFTMCTLKHVTLSRCDLGQAEFNDTKLAGLDLSDSEISGIMVKPADLKGVTVSRDQAVVFAQLLGIHVSDR